MRSRRPVRQHRHRPRRAQLWFLASLLTVLLALSPLAAIAIERLDPVTSPLPDKTAESVPPIAVSPADEPEGTGGSDCTSGKIACPSPDQPANPASPKDPTNPGPIGPKDPDKPKDPEKPKEAKFSITVTKEWWGSDPPDDDIDNLLTVEVVLNRGTTMTLICSWDGSTSTLVRDGTSEPCALSLGAELSSTTLTLDEPGLSDHWIGALTSPPRGRLPVSMTLAELVDSGSCTQPSEGYYECKLVVTNVARPTVQCGDREIPYPETGTYYCLDWRKLWTRNGELAPAPPGDYAVTITVKLGDTVLGTMTCDQNGCTPLATWLDLAALGVTEETLGDLVFTIEEDGLPTGWSLHPMLAEDGATFSELRNPPVEPFVPPACIYSVYRPSLTRPGPSTPVFTTDARIVSCLVYIVNVGPADDGSGGSGGSGGTGGSGGPGGSGGSGGSTGPGSSGGPSGPSGPGGSSGSAPQGSPSAPNTAPPAPADPGVPGNSAPAQQPPASEAAGASAEPDTAAPAGAAQSPPALPQVLPRTGAGTGTLSQRHFPLLGLVGIVLIVAGLTSTVFQRRSP